MRSGTIRRCPHVGHFTILSAHVVGASNFLLHLSQRKLIITYWDENELTGSLVFNCPVGGYPTTTTIIPQQSSGGNRKPSSEIVLLECLRLLCTYEQQNSLLMILLRHVIIHSKYINKYGSFSIKRKDPAVYDR